MIRQTMVAPSLKPSTGPSANHLRLLSLLQGPVTKCSLQFTFHVYFCHQEHLPCEWIRPPSIENCQIFWTVYHSNTSLNDQYSYFLLDWKLPEAQGWIILENIYIRVNWPGLTLIVACHFAPTALKPKA